MTRLRTDQACLEAQMQAGIEQRLTADLAVPCPDCGVEAGRACRDSFDRAVRTHLARAVAANRRDTEPCPAPTESLERASARAFAESLREPGCQCHWEVGDSPCRVHGENEEDPEPARPVCACGQTAWRKLYVEGLLTCGDCFGERFDHGGNPAPLDKRIAETKSDDATECAWSTPTSEGEGWR